MGTFVSIEARVYSSVCGKVVNGITNEGIPNVGVALAFHKAEIRRTNAKGEFCFDDVLLREGVLWISSIPDGLALDTGSTSSKSIEIPEGKNLKDIILSLVPEAKIIGKLLSEDGI